MRKKLPLSSVAEATGEVEAAEGRVAAGLVARAALAEPDVGDLLAVVEVDVAVGALEVAVVVEGERLGDEQVAVACQAQGDVGVDTSELSASAGAAVASATIAVDQERERPPGAHRRSTPPRREVDLGGRLGLDRGVEELAPVEAEQLATSTGGKTWISVLYVSTVSL